MNQVKMKTNQISQVSESAENVMISVQIDGAYENTRKEVIETNCKQNKVNVLMKNKGKIEIKVQENQPF